MWIDTPLLQKYLLMLNSDFDLVHFIDGGYLGSNEHLGKILFANAGSFYIVEVGVDQLGFSFDYSAGSSQRFRKVGSDWILNRTTFSVDMFWKKIGSAVFSSDCYKIDIAANKIIPFPVAPNSESLSSFESSFTRQGKDVWKNNDMTGSFVWQGSGVVDNIIVGWRKYTHKELDSEGSETSNNIDVFESIGLIEQSSNNWVYTYKSKIYTFNGALPLSNFIMTSGEDDLNMTYIELTQLEKSVWNFDGGAQVVG